LRAYARYVAEAPAGPARDEVNVSGVWENRDERTIRNELGREFACSENIDIQIGRVLDKLKAMGELENTYIFYTADHGIAIGGVLLECDRGSRDRRLSRSPSGQAGRCNKNQRCDRLTQLVVHGAPEHYPSSRAGLKIPLPSKFSINGELLNRRLRFCI